MMDVYVHTLRYRYYGRGFRQSRTMFPISYGPFKDEETAREWIRQCGLTRATRLMTRPAPENIKVATNHLAEGRESSPHTPIQTRLQQNSTH